MTFNIPSHGYELTLADGREILMDIGNESQREAVVPVTVVPTTVIPITAVLVPAVPVPDCVVGWMTGPDITSIKDVYDCETEDHLNPVEWAKECVWPFQHGADPKAKPDKRELN